MAKLRKKPHWLQADIEAFDSLLKRLDYPNKVVQDATKAAMGVFVLKHGTAKCDAMAKHLDAGGAMVNGPLVGVKS